MLRTDLCPLQEGVWEQTHHLESFMNLECRGGSSKGNPGTVPLLCGETPVDKVK